MFTPAAFAEIDLVWLDRLMQRDAFVSVITTDAAGLPQVSQLPVLYQRSGQTVVIEGHWARANPQAATAGPMLMLVHGPHGYVSPNWYPDKHSASRVPTWNYASAQLRGAAEPITGQDALADLVDRLSQRNETRAGRDWRLDRDDPRQLRMLAGIVGFRFQPSDIAITLKFSQNHPAANQQSVMAALADRPGSADHELARWMQLRLSPHLHNNPSNPDDAASVARPPSPNTSGNTA